MVLPSSPPEAAPRVRWLDARTAGVDRGGLREWARGASAASRSRYTSRSYCYPFALIAFHSGPVGVDIERIGPIDEAFAASICTPTEDPEPPDGISRERYVTSLWSSKEALAKALGDALSYDPRRLDSPSTWPGGRAGPWWATELRAGPDHVAWLCWREGGSADR